MKRRLELFPKKHFTCQEAHRIIGMLRSSDETIWDLALSIILNSNMRFFEPDRRQLMKQLHYLGPEEDKYAFRTYLIAGQKITYSAGIFDSTPRNPEREEVIDKIKKRHSKVSYRYEGFRVENGRKQYKRSAKNHYS